MTISLDFLPAAIFAFFLIFARVGALSMVLPGLSATTVPARIRLVFALAVSLVLYPLVQPALPQPPATVPGILAALIRELILGGAIGLCVRLILSALEMAASVIAIQTGLALAQSFDPNQGAQSSIFASFFSVLSVALIFALDLHHMLFAAMYDSYKLFPPGEAIPVGDFAQLAISSLSGAFRVALQLTTPFLVFGLIFYLGVGILSRLIPQVQIFFISMPANIFLGFILILLLMSTMMKWYLDYFDRAISPFLGS